MYCSLRTSSMLERVMRAMSADCTRPRDTAGIRSERRLGHTPDSSGT
jgi:hypothetical protein